MDDRVWRLCSACHAGGLSTAAVFSHERDLSRVEWSTAGGLLISTKCLFCRTTSITQVKMGVEIALARLDTSQPLRSFDAFPKMHSFYRHKTRAGGLLSVLLAALVAILCVADASRQLSAHQQSHDFVLDRALGNTANFSIDMTVGMPCNLLSLEWHDAKDDLVHLTNLLDWKNTSLSATMGFPLRTSQQRKHDAACRISGAFPLARIGGSLQVTTAGHGYFDPDHPEAHARHNQMNLTHVIHHFGFGPSIPGEAPPLDGTRDTAVAPFQVFQYYLTLIPTLYIAAGSQVKTVQFSVMQYSRPLWRRTGTPGIFFDISLEGVTLLLRHSRQSLLSALTRACMVSMGAWTLGKYLFKLSTTIFACAGAWTGRSNSFAPDTLGSPPRTGELHQSISHLSRSASTRVRSLARSISKPKARNGHHKSDSLQASIFEEGNL